MRHSRYYSLTFSSTHDAIAMEKYLSKELAISVMPTPRKISASCGISLRVEENDFQRLIELLSENCKIKNSCTIYFADNGNVSLIDT